MTFKQILFGAIAASLIGGAVYTTGRAYESSKPTEVTKTVAEIPVQTSSETTGEVLTPEQVKQGDVKTSTLKLKKVSVSPSNRIFFNVPVTYDTVNVLLEVMDQIDGDIYLELDSPGGEVISGSKVLDYIKNSGKTVHTVCNNICASMAFQIFQVGKTRLMTEKAILMAHPASGGAQGTIENMKALIDMIKLYVDRMDAYTAQRSGLDYNKFKAMVADNIWVETPEALKLGLADGVVFLSSNSAILSNQPQINMRQELKRRGLLRADLDTVRGYVFDLPMRK